MSSAAAIAARELVEDLEAATNGLGSESAAMAKRSGWHSSRNKPSQGSI
jgi:hypothetical protein